MTKIIVAMLALAMALAGCGTTARREAPGVTLEKVAPAATTVQAVTLTPAPVQTALPPTVAVPFTTHPWNWEHPGAARFAATRAEAMQKREEAIRKLGFPEQCVAPLVEEMKKPGEKVTMKMGDRFAAQISRGGEVHGLAEGGGIVAFKTPMLPGMQLVAQAEKWTVICEGQVHTIFLPEVCFNITAGIPVAVSPVIAPPAEKKTPPVARGPVLGCPDVWTLEVKVHENKAFYLPGVEQTHAQEERGVVFIGKRHVSRTHGPQLRKSLEDGGHQHSRTPYDFRVSLIMTSEARNGDTTITEEEFVADITVTGTQEVQFARAQIDRWDAIRVVAKDGTKIVSPPQFTVTGFHEMRFFNKLSGTVNGEWDNPLQKPCFKTEHWIEKKQ